MSITNVRVKNQQHALLLCEQNKTIEIDLVFTHIITNPWGNS